MRIKCIGLFAVAAVLCAIPLSLRWSHSGDVPSLSATFDSVYAAELYPVDRRHRTVVRRARYSRLYDLYCDGPYVGGGFNGGTYYGGPWIDLRCFGGVY
jgi:hypothetical protein